MRSWPSGTDIARVKTMLASAQRPLIVLGGSNWDERGRKAIEEFSKRNEIPVATGFRRQDTYDNTHPCYIGNLGVLAVFRNYLIM